MTSTSNIHHRLLFSIFSFLLLGLVASTTTFLPNNIFEPHGTLGRALLQAKENCRVDFENQNYTIITTKCKGPNYPPKVCCAALKEFACPFAEELVQNYNCADTMFSYINLYGKYPPSLFASQCREDKIGLECPDAEEKKRSSAHIAAPTHSLMLPLTTAAFLLFSYFHFF